MNYAVHWSRLAEFQLIALYIRAADKESLTTVSTSVERILGRNPRDQGEGRASDDERLWFYRPLAIGFAVDESRRTVTVLSARWVGR